MEQGRTIGHRRSCAGRHRTRVEHRMSRGCRLQGGTAGHQRVSGRHWRSRGCTLQGGTARCWRASGRCQRRAERQRSRGCRAGLPEEPRRAMPEEAERRRRSGSKTGPRDAGGAAGRHRRRVEHWRMTEGTVGRRMSCWVMPEEGGTLKDDKGDRMMSEEPLGDAGGAAGRCRRREE